MRRCVIWICVMHWNNSVCVQLRYNSTRRISCHLCNPFVQDIDSNVEVCGARLCVALYECVLLWLCVMDSYLSCVSCCCWCCWNESVCPTLAVAPSPLYHPSPFELLFWWICSGRFFGMSWLQVFVLYPWTSSGSSCWLCCKASSCSCWFWNCTASVDLNMASWFALKRWSRCYSSVLKSGST